MQRVVIIGTSCAGKTTLAGSLANILCVKHIELDALHWEPNWVEAPDDVFRVRAAEAVAADRWVLDGNYGQVRDIVWPRATTVIWLDYSFPLVCYRALKRTIVRIVRKEVIFSQNRESFRMSFLSRESILLWVLKTHHRRRPIFRRLLADPQFAHLKVHVFGSPAETERFLEQVRAGELAAGAVSNS